MCIKICIFIYIDTCIYIYIHAYKWFVDGINSLSSRKSIFLTEHSDNTIFSTLSIKLTLFYRANKPLPDGWPRLLQAVITFHTHLSLQIQIYDWRVDFPHVLFHSSLASEQMMPRSYLQLLPTLLTLSGGALPFFLGEGKVSYEDVFPFRAKCHLIEWSI